MTKKNQSIRRIIMLGPNDKTQDDETPETEEQDGLDMPIPDDADVDVEEED